MNKIQPAVETRGSFGTNFGFIMAAVGSAVGLGNIWKFPYITGVYGGGAFVLVYLACILLVGLPLMYAELIIGQRGGKNVLGAMRDLTAKAGITGKIFSYGAGIMAVLSGFFILSFYSVVAGWAIHFLLISAGAISDTTLATSGAFGELVGNAKLSSIWHTVFMVLAMGVVTLGVHKGIEFLCKILMPVLFLILTGLLVYVGTTGGLGQSLSFLFKPDFSKLSGKAVLEALGHAFFTLSLGMGAMVTYGSYLKSEKHVVRDGVAIAFLDTLIALMAGAVIFAVTFAHNHDPEAGPGLLFATLPSLFATMPYGNVVSTIFFLLVVFAAWSSAISLLEVVVAYFVDEFNMPRGIVTWVAGIGIWGLGLLSACGIKVAGTGMSTFDLLDEITTNYMLPLGGLCIALVAGWMISKQDRDSGFADLGTIGKFLAISWTFTIRFLTPALVILVLLYKLKAFDQFLT